MKVSEPTDPFQTEEGELSSMSVMEGWSRHYKVGGFETHCHVVWQDYEQNRALSAQLIF
jgi:hypothetical protein